MRFFRDIDVKTGFYCEFVDLSINKTVGFQDRVMCLILTLQGVFLDFCLINCYISQCAMDFSN